MARALRLYLSLALLVQPLLFAQNPAPQAPQAPQQPQQQPQQQGQQQDAPFVFKSAVNLVTFSATVTDGSGRYVRGLRKENVGLFEDGVRQTISMFKFEPEPVSVGIVFDT